MKDFSASRVNNSAVQLTWISVNSATGYTVYYSSNDCPCLIQNQTFLVTTTVKTIGATTHAVIGGLDASQTYRFFVGMDYFVTGVMHERIRSQSIQLAAAGKQVIIINFIVLLVAVVQPSPSPTATASSSSMGEYQVDKY